ncbi:metal dependent phosphohydrolase [Calderihabitans maritimus]|uniref:Metal dependent phosphohydrolase n=2 Tax=Calderihabitans maritimus TaxID=1246530 RepID=A0A1Z5HU42_9FIRM|nr:metal dependent phosphohydrolase [Calderihabitans maritimus]
MPSLHYLLSVKISDKLHFQSAQGRVKRLMPELVEWLHQKCTNMDASDAPEVINLNEPGLGEGSSGEMGLLFPVNDREGKCFGFLFVLGEQVCSPQQTMLIRVLLQEFAALLERYHTEFQISNLSWSILESAVRAIEAKDVYTSGHSNQVSRYSVLIGQGMRLPEWEQEALRYAGMLHDIGKIGVSEQILRKPGKLSEKEFREIQQHPVVGAKILQPIKLFKPIIGAVKHHHERYDGTGYPDGLKGEEIPLFARIVAVADAYDAMTSDRVYRKALSSREALAEMKRNIGSQFDPEVVDVFLRQMN